jgi:hypothetical protein
MLSFIHAAEILCILTLTDFIVAGGYEFAKISPNGDIVWSKLMDTSVDRELYTFAEGTDGYYFCGYTDKYPEQLCLEDNNLVMQEELTEVMMPLY